MNQNVTKQLRVLCLRVDSHVISRRAAQQQITAMVPDTRMNDVLLSLAAELVDAEAANEPLRKACSGKDDTISALRQQVRALTDKVKVEARQERARLQAAHQADRNSLEAIIADLQQQLNTAAREQVSRDKSQHEALTDAMTRALDAQQAIAQATKVLTLKPLGETPQAQEVIRLLTTVSH